MSVGWCCVELFKFCWMFFFFFLYEKGSDPITNPNLKCWKNYGFPLECGYLSSIDFRIRYTGPSLHPKFTPCLVSQLTEEAEIFFIAVFYLLGVHFLRNFGCVPPSRWAFGGFDLPARKGGGGGGRERRDRIGKRVKSFLKRLVFFCDLTLMSVSLVASKLIPGTRTSTMHMVHLGKKIRSTEI